MSFASLSLHSDLLAVLESLGYQTPTPIQLKAIPEVLAGHDVLAGAQTGTGKTAAFALPLIHRDLTRLNQNSEKAIRVLVLTPTRELAQQVYKSFLKYSQDSELNIVVAYGGASINPQIEALNKGCDVLVATPGRLLELVIKELIDLSHIETLVLDEADRMLDMGFITDINRILKRLPDTHQTLFFSATFNDDVFALSKTILNAPKLIEVAERNATAEKIEQRFYEVDTQRKAAMLAYLIGSNNWQQVLIFTRTKQAVDELVKELAKDGIKAVAVHGDKSQGARDRGLEEFKNGKVRALVATDVAARGLDIKELQYVINFELPYNAEDYIHRIGRTGRAGQTGVAVSLVSHKEKYLFEEVKTLTGEEFLMQWFAGFEPDFMAQEEADRGKRKPSKKSLRARALGQNKGSKVRADKRRQR
ncbi:DEAD/DEAH box helicase [Oceanospirillum sediminis]|uniref:DEAD-box ATP-dependent RNA helicase RhpA n=1 Tax=Oceanospirillum sediminis TaxID=2760088 RepID=A0A839IRL8_9GAMM|nr:DEAD/DEAH box helicase [Oceanospirillum sediminis]MBB1487561.1 DEAD/DEAH box helicase [Oceanospirillum sediminis]